MNTSCLACITMSYESTNIYIYMCYLIHVITYSYTCKTTCININLQWVIIICATISIINHTSLVYKKKLNFSSLYAFMGPKQNVQNIHQWMHTYSLFMYGESLKLLHSLLRTFMAKYGHGGAVIGHYIAVFRHL